MAGSARRRVVVVEDDRQIRESFAELLEAVGHQVSTASDGVTGAELVIAARPDIAFVDLLLPGISGLEVAKRVREALGSDILLVAATGEGQTTPEQVALDAGFDEYLLKPFDFGRVREMLENVGVPGRQRRG